MYKDRSTEYCEDIEVVILVDDPRIVKHSAATKAIIQLLHYDDYDDYTHISIEDNGVGINRQINSLGIGLLNIQSRIEFLNSNLNTDSNKNYF